MSWYILVLALAVVQISAYSVAPPVFASYGDNVVNRQGRILSGWDAVPGQHPHHANLRVVDHWGNGFGCGGSIISRDWVVTAAHCTTTHAFVQVRAGMVRLIEATYIAESREWYNHPTWNPNSGAVQPNDISIIRLPIPVVFTSLVRAIRMPPLAQSYVDYSGRQLVATGHGRIWTDGPVAETLQWVYLSGVSNNVCFGVFGGLITANTVCAQFFNVTSQSPCQGDNGGPLVDTVGGVPYLIGISSFVAGGAGIGCHSGFPAGFCRTAPFQPWFTQVTGEDFENIEVDTTVAPPTITTESWNTTTSGPWNTTTDSWNTTTSTPWTPTTESWNTTTSGPWNTTTESWNTTTSGPWNTTTDSWNTTTSTPWTQTTDWWNTTTSGPWNTTTDSWNTTTSTPWTQTTEWWNTTTSGPWNTTTDSWNTTTSTPWTQTTDWWNTTTSGPWNTTTDSWNTTTSTPWTQTTDWWNTTTSGPWNTTTDSWNTTTSGPWNTTTDSWSTTTSGPWNTTTEWWTTTTSAPWNTTTDSWNTTTSGPWNTTTDSWSTTTSAPWDATTDSWTPTVSNSNPVAEEAAEKGEVDKFSEKIVDVYQHKSDSRRR